MARKITNIFPMIWVDVSLWLTMLAVGGVFYSEPLAVTTQFRWNVPIKLLSLSNEANYSDEMFKDTVHIAAFAFWTFQNIVTIHTVIYHLTTPAHPKFYSTFINTAAIITHMIGGTMGIAFFYIGAVLNRKDVCFLGFLGGLFLHLPTVVWQNRQTHGQRELSMASYSWMAFTLLQTYVDFIIYDAPYSSVFACGMALNVFAMVRFFGFVSTSAGIEVSYDRTLAMAAFANLPFFAGPFSSFVFCCYLALWNVYFSWIKPCPKFMMRVEHGYSDTIPEKLEKEKGTTFEKELAIQKMTEPDHKEAIAKAIWKVLAGSDGLLDVREVVVLYTAWGMPDAESAAEETFHKYDADHSGHIEYDEFRKAFDVLVTGIFIKGESEEKMAARARLEAEETAHVKEE